MQFVLLKKFLRTMIHRGVTVNCSPFGGGVEGKMAPPLSTQCHNQTINCWGGQNGQKSTRIFASGMEIGLCVNGRGVSTGELQLLRQNGV